MKYIFFFLLIISSKTFAQNVINAKLVDNKGLYINSYIAIDNLNALYYTSENTFFKRENNKTQMYANVQLGTISSANTFNPLKINLFYKDFNTVVILDNRLAEIFKIDFNRLKTYKNITHITTGHDNTLWLFNQDNLQLELYDYKTNKIRGTTLPIAEPILDLKSDYNYSWLLTEKHIYCYNYFASLVKKIPNTGFETIEASNKNLILKKGNELFFLKKDEEEIHRIDLPELLINQFSVMGETLYIYNGELLYQYQLNFD